MQAQVRVSRDIAFNSERKARNDEALLVVGKSLTDKRLNDIRDNCWSGVYDLDHVVRIQGRMAIHEDYEQPNPAKACPWTFLQVAWNKMNTATRNACIQEAQRYIRDGVKPDVKELKVCTQKAVAAVIEETRSTHRGSVVFNGRIWVAS